MTDQSSKLHPYNAKLLRKTSFLVIAFIVALLLTGLTVETVGAQATITFGNQAVGTTSGVQTYTLNNPFFPSGSLSITAIGVTGDFGIAPGSSCVVGSLTAASCGVNLNFTPTAVGTRNGTLTITTASGNAIVPLTGTGTTGNNPVSTIGLPTIPPPPTVNPLASPVAPVLLGTISGRIFLNGKATAGFKVRIEPLSVTTTTDFGGRYYFGDLQAGTYVIRVIEYAQLQVSPVNGRDFSNQTIANGSTEDAIDFQFTSTVPPTVAATPTTVATATPQPTIAIPTNTSSSGNNITPQCPAPGNSNLQVAMRGTPVDESSSFLCIRISLGTNTNLNADLNNTVMVSLPAAANQISASSGTTGVSRNTITWRPGILSPGQSSTLIIGLDAQIAELGSVSTNVTGTFSSGEGFSRTLPGLVPVAEIVPNAVVRTVVPPTPVRQVVRPPANPPNQPAKVPNTGEPAAPQAGYSLDFGLTIAIALFWLTLTVFILWKVITLTYKSQRSPKK